MSILSLLESRQNVMVRERSVGSFLRGADLAMSGKKRKADYAQAVKTAGKNPLSAGRGALKVVGAAAGTYLAGKAAKAIYRGGKKLFQKARGTYRGEAGDHKMRKPSTGMRSQEAYAPLLELSTGLRTRAALKAHGKYRATQGKIRHNIGIAQRTSGAVKSDAIKRGRSIYDSGSMQKSKRQANRFKASVQSDRSKATWKKRAKTAAKVGAGIAGAYAAYRVGKAILSRRPKRSSGMRVPGMMMNG